jgi:3'-phosphoadenosine 5'-phosphosulfate sulfotransferase (PAPS reductase)/FAD synthetase
MYWLSYGGGVNSTALAVLLCEGALPEFAPWEAIFADTGDEKDETYAYIEHQFRPYLARHGKGLHVCRDRESVLERWERHGITGSRIIRSCTDHAKIRPMKAYRDGVDADAISLVGIDADEPGRARPRDRARYPLVEAGIGRAACRAIIARAGLCVPAKSGCWHCPFARRREVLDLARDHPERFARIAELEDVANELHPGAPRTQWGERPATEWAALARAEREQGRLPIDLGSDPDDMPCGCYDG